MKYFQDQLKHNHCFGCGNENDSGLKIKSYWDKDGQKALCHFKPQYFHSTVTTKFLNGGIISTIMDCHSIWTAIAYSYQLDELEIGEGEDRWYVTSSINIEYNRPTPMNKELLLEAKVLEAYEKKIVVKCILKVEDKICVEAIVRTVHVPSSWLQHEDVDF